MRSQSSGIATLVILLAAIFILLLTLNWTESASLEKPIQVGVATPTSPLDSRPTTTQTEGLDSPTKGSDREDDSEADLTPAAARRSESSSEAALQDTYVQGRVVDARTGEPVPDLGLILRRSGKKATARTGGDGAFKSHRPLPSGSLGIECRDARSLIDHSIGGHENQDSVLVKVAIGPTCPLRLRSNDPNLANWKVRIIESRQEPGSAGSIEVLENGLRFGDTGAAYGGDVADRQWPWVDIRPGNPPWIRYPLVSWSPHPKYQPYLEVLHVSGTQRGFAKLESTVGIQAVTDVDSEPVEPLGAVVGRVTDPSGRIGSATVVLLPTDAELDRTDKPPIFEEQSTASTGAFRFERIPTGPRELLIYAVNRHVKRLTVTVTPGTQDLGDFVLENAEGWDWGVNIRFPARKEPMPDGPRYMSRLRLAAAGPYARAWLTHDGWGPTRDGSLYHFDLPASEFEHLGVGDGMAPRWGPARVFLPSQNPGDDPYVLQEFAPEERTTMGFDVSDIEGGAPITQFQVHFGPGGAMSYYSSAQLGSRWTVAPKTPLAWTVWAPGFAPSCGSEMDMVTKEDEEIASVQLARGWGAVLYFRVGQPRRFLVDPGPWKHWTFPTASHFVGEWAAPPLANVQVLIDGDPVVRSDGEGKARLAIEDRPAELTLACPGWKIAGMEPVYLGYQGKGNLPYLYIVWMERE